MSGIDDATKFGVDTAQKIRDGISSALGRSDGSLPWGLGVIADALAAFTGALTAIVVVAFGAIFRVASNLAAIFLEGIAVTVKDNQDALNGLISAAMSELLGVEVGAEGIGPGGDPNAQRERAMAIGGKLHDLLIGEFGGNAGPSGIDGQKAARAFTGFNINFSVRAGILSIMTELESLGFIKGFREIGEEMAMSLGLGRLHRQALRPLIQHLIALPYDRLLAARYQQNRMPITEFLHARAAGLVDFDVSRDQLKEYGLPDDQTAALVILTRKKITPAEFDTLVRHGDKDTVQFQAELTEDGYAPTTAQSIIKAQGFNRLDRAEHEYATELLTLARQGHIPASEFTDAISTLHFTDAENEIWLKRLQAIKSPAKKRLSFAQIMTLMEHAQLTTDYIDRWAAAEGYDEEDTLNLQVLAAIKTADEAEILKVKKYRWQQAVAKAQKQGTQPPPAPPDVS